MSEPIKEQVEKWRCEFENDFMRLYPERLKRSNINNEVYENDYTWCEWKAYFAAKKSDFEEIKTLKEQLAEFVKLAKLGVYSVEGLLTHNHESWELSTESWLLKAKTFIEKQDKENKDEK